ncbi:MAG: hypothetical protein ABL994_23460, partial [Verrucomicrobiales bacterium]
MPATMRTFLGHQKRVAYLPPAANASGHRNRPASRKSEEVLMDVRCTVRNRPVERRPGEMWDSGTAKADFLGEDLGTFREQSAARFLAGYFEEGRRLV